MRSPTQEISVYSATKLFPLNKKPHSFYRYQNNSSSESEGDNQTPNKQSEEAYTIKAPTSEYNNAHPTIDIQSIPMTKHTTFKGTIKKTGVMEVDCVNYKEVLKGFHTKYNDLSQWFVNPLTDNVEEIKISENINTIDDDSPNPQNAYCQKVFELEKDTGDFHETCFDDLKTDYFLKDSEDPKIYENDMKNYERAQMQKLNALICKQDTEDTRVDENVHKQSIHNSNFIASKNLWIVQNEKLHNGRALLSPLIPKMLICSTDNNTLSINFSVPFTGYVTMCKIDKTKATFNDEMPFMKFLSQGLLHSMTITPVKIVTCGYYYCVVLTEDGGVASWGYGANGCLGQGNFVSYTSPKIIKGIEGRVVYIEAGGFHTAAITDKGDLYMWGRNDEGQLSIDPGVTEQDKYGSLLTTPAAVLSGVVQVSLGEAHTLVVEKNDQCALCGRLVRASKTYIWKHFTLGESIREICSGVGFSLILCNSGGVYCIENNMQGQIGKLYGKDKSIQMGKVSSPEYIQSVSCSSQSALLLGNSLEVYIWGAEAIKQCEQSDLLLFIKDKELKKETELNEGMQLKLKIQLAGNITQRKRTNHDIGANGGTTLKNESTLNLNSTNATTAESSKFSCGVLKSIKEANSVHKKATNPSPHKLIKTNFGRYQMSKSPKASLTSRTNNAVHNHCVSTINTLLKEIRKSPKAKK